MDLNPENQVWAKKRTKIKDKKLHIKKINFENDIIFNWNGTSSGVCVPDGEWISKERKLCEGTKVRSKARYDHVYAAVMGSALHLHQTTTRFAYRRIDERLCTDRCSDHMFIHSHIARSD